MENIYDATYTNDVAKLDYDACIEFMIMAMWEKAERDRCEELWQNWSILPRPHVYNEAINPSDLLFRIKCNEVLADGDSFYFPYGIAIM